MDWTRAIDAYCERTGPEFWSEPVNALSNVLFLIAAMLMWRRSGGQVMPRLLSANLLVIGIGSFLFHTVAQAWAGIADSLSILAFALLYIYAANRDFWGFRVVPSALGAAAFLPFTAALTPVFGALPFFAISAYYWPLPLLIAVYAFLLRNRAPDTARGLAVGAGVLVLSLTFRSLDGPLCATTPFGTHFLWHTLNALMLGWMIEVLRGHLATAARGR